MSLNKLSYLISESVNPYHNIALEEYLLKHTEPGECILYLWQNRKTVVIGYNQNPWKECKTEVLEADGGYLARRLSGGGAVFHDMGNLNFTFLVRETDYNTEKQAEVILRAVQSFGIPAIKNGRNDLTAEGRKFSGNAYYKSGDFCYHHGTILIRADKSEMGRYLNVSQEKLKSKGVDSVKSRVVNLSEYVPDMTISQMREALLHAFESVYGICPQPLSLDRISEEEIEAGMIRFASWDWKYGRKISFQYEVSKKFCWGEVLIQLDVSEGVVQQAVVWSDGLDIEFPKAAGRALIGTKYLSADWDLLPEKVEGGAEAAKMMEDIIQCLKEDR
ncbi:MAG: lipoate--protein ligase [Lachnospiraceae bacterium]